MIRRLIPLLLAAVALCGCASVSRLDAGGDVHDFLVAVRNDDRAAFEAHVDRQALKAQLEARLLAETRRANVSSEWQALAAILAKPAADLAGDALIRPRVFRAAAEYMGYSPQTPIPNRLVLAGALKYRPDGRVCATRRQNGACLFVFTREGSLWKLTGFEGALGDLKGR